MKRISAVMILLLFSVVVVAAPVAAAESYIFEPFEIAFYVDFFPNPDSQNYIYEGILPPGLYDVSLNATFNGLPLCIKEPLSVSYDLEQDGYPLAVVEFDLYGGDMYLSRGSLRILQIEECTLVNLALIYDSGYVSNRFFDGATLVFSPVYIPPSYAPLTAVFQMAYNVMQTPMTIYDFTFSWWDVFMWSALAGVAAFFLGRYFNA